MSVSKLMGESLVKAPEISFSNHSFVTPGSSARLNKKAAPVEWPHAAQSVEGVSAWSSLKQVAADSQPGRAVLVASYSRRTGIDDNFYLRGLINNNPAWKSKEVYVLNEVFSRYRSASANMHGNAALIELADTLRGLGITDFEDVITLAGEKKLHAMHDTGLWPSVKLGIAPVALTENGAAFKQPLFLVLESMSKQLQPDPEAAYRAINPRQRQELEANIAEAIQQFGNAGLYSGWVSKLPLPEAIKGLGQR